MKMNHTVQCTSYPLNGYKEYIFSTQVIITEQLVNCI